MDTAVRPGARAGRAMCAHGRRWGAGLRGAMPREQAPAVLCLCLTVCKCCAVQGQASLLPLSIPNPNSLAHPQSSRRWISSSARASMPGGRWPRGGPPMRPALVCGDGRLAAPRTASASCRGIAGAHACGARDAERWMCGSTCRRYNPLQMRRRSVANACRSGGGRRHSAPLHTAGIAFTAAAGLPSR